MDEDVEKPKWADDYVFYPFSSKMPKNKITACSSQQLLPICPECKTSVPQGVKFETHVVECNKKMTWEKTCKICDKVMLSVQYLKRHMKLKHCLDLDTSKDDKCIPSHSKLNKGKSDKKPDVEEDWDHDPDIELMCYTESENENNDKRESGEKENVETKKSLVFKKDDNNNDQVLSGRVYRKSTMPLLPGKRKVDEMIDLDSEGMSSKTKFTKTVNKETKINEDERKVSYSVKEANKMRQAIDLDQPSLVEKKQKKPIAIELNRSEDKNIKKQKLVIQSGDEICYETSALCQRDKNISGISVNLGDYITGGLIETSDINFIIDESGIIKIKMSPSKHMTLK
jgi:hypothetical protein